MVVHRSYAEAAARLALRQDFDAALLDAFCVCLIDGAGGPTPATAAGNGGSFFGSAAGGFSRSLVVRLGRIARSRSSSFRRVFASTGGGSVGRVGGVWGGSRQSVAMRAWLVELVRALLDPADPPPPSRPLPAASAAACSPQGAVEGRTAAVVAAAVAAAAEIVAARRAMRRGQGFVGSFAGSCVSVVGAVRTAAERFDYLTSKVGQYPLLLEPVCV